MCMQVGGRVNLRENPALQGGQAVRLTAADNDTGLAITPNPAAFEGRSTLEPTPGAGDAETLRDRTDQADPDVDTPAPDAPVDGGDEAGGETTSGDTGGETSGETSGDAGGGEGESGQGQQRGDFIQEGTDFILRNGATIASNVGILANGEIGLRDVNATIGVLDPFFSAEDNPLVQASLNSGRQGVETAEAAWQLAQTLQDGGDASAVITATQGVITQTGALFGTVTEEFGLTGRSASILQGGTVLASTAADGANVLNAGVTLADALGERDIGAALSATVDLTQQGGTMLTNMLENNVGGEAQAGHIRGAVEGVSMANTTLNATTSLFRAGQAWTEGDVPDALDASSDAATAVGRLLDQAAPGIRGSQLPGQMRSAAGGLRTGALAMETVGSFTEMTDAAFAGDLAGMYEAGGEFAGDASAFFANRMNRSVELGRDGRRESQIVNRLGMAGQLVNLAASGETLGAVLPTAMGMPGRIADAIQDPSSENIQEIANDGRSITAAVGAVAQTARTTIHSGTMTNLRNMAEGFVDAANSPLGRVVAENADVAVRGASMMVRGAARLVPGANVAMAGVDIVQAGADIRRAFEDPSADTIINAGISSARAAASVVAASNIPAASQIGGAIATGLDVAQFVYNNRETIIPAAQQAVARAGQVVQGVAQAAGERVSQATTQVTQAATRQVRQAATQVQQTVQRVQTQVQQGVQRAQQTVQRAQQTVQQGVQRAQQTVQRAQTQVQQGVQRAQAQANQALNQASQAYNRMAANFRLF